jgi:hypothetical protein
MKTNSDLLKDLYQGYAESRKSADRKDCPSAEAMVSSFEPSASRRKKKKIIDHLTECSPCREEFMLIMKLQESDAMPDKHADGAAPPYSRAEKVRNGGGGFSSVWQYVYALLGIGLIVTSLFLPDRSKQISDVPRSKEISLALLYPTSTHALSDKLIFRWQEKRATQYYVLELFDESLMPIWTSPGIRETQIELPFEIGQKIRTGGSYYWMVTAYSDTWRRTESKLTRFEVPDRE